MNNKEFLNKVIIVTGASSGIGKECALELASKGAVLVLAARNDEKLKEVEKRIIDTGGQALPVITDVSKKEDCENLINQTVNQFGKIDILINNAGISMRAKFGELDISVIEKIMRINFFGTVYCTKYALPYILKQKGSVVGVSSISGLAPLPGRTGYSASKYAMTGFLNALRLEYKEEDLHVLVAYPGFTKTNIRYTALDKNGNPQKESMRNENRMMSSEKAAEIIVKGIANRKREIIMTKQGKLLVWLYKRCPRITDKFIYNDFKKEFDSPE